jgi:hypothetical protein
MPLCTLGQACNFPGGDVRRGHLCRGCGNGVHIFCAIVDESQPLSSNATCLRCAGVLSQDNSAPNKKPAPASKTTAANATNNPTDTSLPTHKKPTSKLKKTKGQQTFTVETQRKQQDYVLQKPVAFDIKDGNYGEEVYKHFLGITKDEEELQSSLTAIGQRSYLLGSVASVVKRKSTTQKFYNVQWEDDRLGLTPIDLQVILAANEFYLKIKKSSAPRKKTTKFLEKNIRRSLAFIDELNKCGDPCDSIDLNDSQSDSDDEAEACTVPVRRHPPIRGTASQDGYRWSAVGTMRPPPDLSQRRESFVDPKYTKCFKTPVSHSFHLFRLKYLMHSPCIQICMHTT